MATDAATRATTEPARHAAGAAPEPAKGRAWPRPWQIWGPVAVILLLLDLTFNLWFWRIPKVTGTGDWGYQFHIDLRRLHEPKPPGVLRVIAFGSSVSGSFDPHQVQSLLDTVAPGVEVHRLMKPGIKPADYRLLFEAEGARLQPDVVVFTFNLLDFLSPSFERGFRAAVREALPPCAVLRAGHDARRALGDTLDLAAACVSNLYRYRKEIDAAISGHARLAWQWLRSRPGGAAYGIYPDGHTRQRFGLPAPGDGPFTVEYFVDPEWIRQRGRVRLTFGARGETLAERVETESGWKRVTLDLRGRGARRVDVVADSTWSPRAGGASDDARLLGVRLRETPRGADGARQALPFRYPPRLDGEIEPFLRMGEATGDAFAARWQEVLNAPTAFGQRFRAYRDAKLQACSQPFEPSGEYAETRRLVAMLAERGVTVILVNTPESPWLLREYENTPYYRAYLHFFEGLAATYPNVRFYDLRDALPPQDFNDWHHPNFVGGIKLGPRYADMLQSARAARARQPERGA